MDSEIKQTGETVTLVGGGIVGLFTAWTLFKEGLNVRVIERLQCGAGASNAAGGILMPLHAWRYLSIVSRLVLHGNQVYPDICTQLLAQTNIDCECRQIGLLALNLAKRDVASEWSENHKLDYTPIHHASLRHYVPGCTANAHDAILFPTIHQLTPTRLVQALKLALLENGVSILENTEVKTIVRKSNGQYQINTTNKAYESSKVVWAAGAWPPVIGAESKTFQWPVVPVRGQMIRYAKSSLNLKHIVLCDEHYLIPRADGTILVGSTLERVGFNTNTTQQAFDELRAKSIELFPELRNASIIEHWAGLRPESPDNIPIICEHPSLRGLYFNTGHYRYGVAMAPASASLLADLMLKRDPSYSMEEFMGPFRELHHAKTIA